ncbi:SH3 domain-containing protein [Bacillus cytotoxicus]|uniref:SH3 domain-containing protein n=1 Tax=Bacillus cytotoxicus TaxID=580165 RepID=A0ACC6A5T6_9BACI|nr:SH3 domain-containing protein [Bacillus cytotoxicus]
MKKYLAGLAAVSVAGAAAPAMGTVQAETPGQTAQQPAAQTTKAAPKSDTKYTVNADVLRVRTGPSTNSDVSSRVYEGQTLNVIGQENGWYKISYNGKVGYVSGEFVNTGTSNNGSQSQGNTTVQPASGNYTVNVSSLRVRTGPSTSHTQLGAVHKGQVVQVTGEVQDWFKINYGGQNAYVSKDYVTKGGSDTNAGQDNQQQNNNNVTVQTGGTYVVDATSLRVRTGPATYQGIIGGVLKGQTLNVIGAENGWFKVKHNGNTGYVSSEFVKFVKGGTSTSNPSTNNNNNTSTQGSGEYYINVSSLNVRGGAGMDYGIIGSLPQGQKVQVLADEYGWSKISYNGRTGYIGTRFLSKTPVSGGQENTSAQKPAENNNNNTSAQGSGAYYVNASALNVRGGAGTNYGVIGALPQGQKVQVLADESGWSKVNYNGRTGYVGTRFLSKTPVSGGQENTSAQKPGENNTSNNSRDTSSLLSYAQSMEGVPYVWGGTSANGVDCSGYIYHVYHKFGYSISRQSVAGYWSSFQHTSNPQPGDLIYFKDTYKSGPSHIGIYLGGGSFIQAGDKGVKVASLNNSYWSSHFLGYSKPY